MPIQDTNKTKTPYIDDRDEDVFIGLDMPLHRGDDRNGNFAATFTTLEAVKVNVRNLLQTELGERPMQPTLGVRLKQYLFEPFNDDVKVNIQNEILDTFSVEQKQQNVTVEVDNREFFQEEVEQQQSHRF